MPHPPHPLATLDQILSTPSRRDAVPEDIEADLRVAGCMLIQEAGVMLQLPQSTMATAQVLLHRFFYVSSLLSFSINEIATASLYLSSKLTESPIRLLSLLHTTTLLLSRRSHLSSHPSLLLSLPPHTLASVDPLTPAWEWEAHIKPFPNQAVYEMKESLVVAEMQILKRLGFNMQVDLAYSHLVNYCQILNLTSLPGVVQLAWSILNDCHLLPLPTHHPPPTLACTAILLATRLRAVPLPDKWWVLFDAEWEDVWDGAGWVGRLWEEWGVGGEKAEEEKVEQDSEATDDDERIQQRQRQKDAQDVKIERWIRAWKLCTSKRRVKRYLEDRGKSVDAVGSSVDGQ